MRVWELGLGLALGDRELDAMSLFLVVGRRLFLSREACSFDLQLGLYNRF